MTPGVGAGGPEVEQRMDMMAREIFLVQKARKFLRLQLLDPAWLR